MARIESSLQVSKSVQDVFAFMNVADNHARFIPNMAEFRQTSSGAFGQVGTKVRGLLNYFGILKIEVPYEIIEVEPDHRLAMKGKMGPVQFKDGYVLSPMMQGTQIKFWLELNPTGWSVLFKPFAGLIGRIHARETLANLNRELNGSD
jgi:polyketide cyclase/dehydrase/lipid transport protein